MKISTLLVAAILMGVLLTTATARRRGRGPARHPKMRHFLCEVTNTTSAETCTNTCPDFADCIAKAPRGDRTSEMTIKFCKPKECDPEVEDSEGEGSCPEGSACATVRGRRGVTKSRCMPEDIHSITVADGEVACELPKSARGGRRGGRRRGGRQHRRQGGHH